MCWSECGTQSQNRLGEGCLQGTDREKTACITVNNEMRHVMEGDIHADGLGLST